jgi:hypothetical protein
MGKIILTQRQDQAIFLSRLVNNPLPFGHGGRAVVFGETMKLRCGISLLVASVLALRGAPVWAALDFNNYDALHLSNFPFSHARPPGDWLNPIDLPGSVSNSTFLNGTPLFTTPSVNSSVPVFDFGNRPGMVIEPSMLMSGAVAPALGALASTAPATRKGAGGRSSDSAAGANWGGAMVGLNGVRQLGLVDISSSDASDGTVILQLSNLGAGAISADGVSSASALDATTLMSASVFLVTAGLAAGALRRRQ